jgi:hypothetical protein
MAKSGVPTAGRKDIKPVGPGTKGGASTPNPYKSKLK